MFLPALCLVVLCLSRGLQTHAQQNSACPRPVAGSLVAEPPDLQSQQGVLEAHLTARNAPDPDGSMRYCYTDAAGKESPNLRVSPGDLVILHLTNALQDVHRDATTHATMDHMHGHELKDMNASNPCTSGIMSALSTNLHFHGLTIRPYAIRTMS